MTPLAITGIYAAALTGFYLVLSARVIVMRRGNRISLGDGDSTEMQRRIRAHGNFAEYVPLGLVLLAVAESQQEAVVWLHAVGGLLLAGRLMHGINFSFGMRSMVLRTGGMMLTFTSLLLGAVLAIPF